MKQKGFTLIEILLYIAVLSIIIVTISASLLWISRVQGKAEAVREVSDNARRALDTMTREIREAKSIYTPSSSSTQLSLETSKYLPTGHNTTFIDFFLCGASSTTICFKKENQDPVALTSDQVEVSNLEFSIIASTTPSVLIKLDVIYREANFLATTTVSLRNY